MPEISDGMIIKWMTYLVTRDAEFIELYADVIHPETFEIAEISYLFREALGYHAKYSQPLSGEALSLGLEQTPDIVGFDKDLVFHLWDEAPEPSVAMRQYVIDLAADFFKRKLMRKEMDRALDLLDENRVDDANDLLQGMTQDISAVGDRDLGHALLNDVGQFLDEMRQAYDDDGNGVSCGMRSLDKVMRGGLRPGQLAVFLGAPGKGKSQALTHVTRSAFEKGRKVLFYSLEMSTREVGERLWSGLVDMSTNEIDADLDEFCDLVKKKSVEARALGFGDVRIKTYPAKQATVATLSAHCSLLRKLDGWIPDLIVVDYADILKPDRQYDVRRDELAVVYEDLRALATTLNVPIWTACQMNREGSIKVTPALEHVSDSWDKAKTADYIFALAQSETELRNNEMRILALKSRHNTSPDPIVVNIDFSMSIFYDYGVAA